jgi:hypothetical protein
VVGVSRFRQQRRAVQPTRLYKKRSRTVKHTSMFQSRWRMHAAGSSRHQTASKHQPAAPCTHTAANLWHQPMSGDCMLTMYGCVSRWQLGLLLTPC